MIQATGQTCICPVADTDHSIVTLSLLGRWKTNCVSC